MRADRHWDPVENLEKELLTELEGITKQLGGNMKQLIRVDHTGKSSKIIQIEYEINEGNH